MKLEEGMFIRFDGMINKILEIDEDYIVFDMNWYDHWNDEVSRMKIDEFIKEYEPQVSDKLIDLIEVGDYANGYKVTGKDNFSIGINLLNEYEQNWEWLCEDEIQSIVTKEIFEQMSYKVGD